ncbi:MAG: serine/threonine protein phosphatase [Oscillospiraceae bacterium]|nr:serine/threonine protein phosphatase [Oscillospiraceae bacterium]
MAFSFFRRNRRGGVQSDALPLMLSAPRAAPARALECPAPPAPSPAEFRLYDALRFQVPVIDAAIHKIVRLTGGFRLTAPDPQAQELLDRFSASVPVNAAGTSLQMFADQMLDSLLTYGNAAGEILTADGEPAALVTVHPQVLGIAADSAAQCRYFLRDPESGTERPLLHPERILFAALDPPAGGTCGVSVLRGLPAVSGILMRIYECIGQNYDRAGNIRYAVTYQPDAAAAGFAKEHAQQIAAAWQEGLNAAKCGEVQDFIAVGDVAIKVIGAENQLFDTNVPVRQLLEQIVSKLSIPPFLLGLSWSTTERMSAQQADILTSELEYFRRILSPMLRKIGAAVLHSAGYALTPEIEWSNINLQDETELAEARLKNAQAKEIELRNEKASQGGL